ncbi:MAG TPA: hypothetical protein VNZ58_03780, partial [Thermomicrobiales bacterium]|nr:hypothetical protein [Thermomicrobiales bacterium]
MTIPGIHERPMQSASTTAPVAGPSPQRYMFLAILMALLTLIPFGSVRAQDLDATAGQLDLANLDGIRTAVSRTYAADIATLVERMTASPPAGAAQESPLLMLGLIAEFDTADHAEKAADTIRDRLEKQANDDGGFTIDSEEAPSLGDHAWQFTGSHVTAETSLEIAGDIVQQGTRAVLTMVVGQNAT